MGTGMPINQSSPHLADEENNEGCVVWLQIPKASGYNVAINFYSQLLGR